MPEGPGAKDAAHPFTDEERASGQDVFGLGERERRAVPGPGRRGPDPGAAVSVRAANPALDPRDRRSSCFG
jgi:hypothetical protein